MGIPEGYERSDGGIFGAYASRLKPTGARAGPIAAEGFLGYVREK